MALYTCLNGVLTFWIWGVEKGKVYVGTSPSGDKVSVLLNVKVDTWLTELSID